MPKQLHGTLLDLLEALDYTKDEKIELVNLMTEFMNILAKPEQQKEKIEKPIIGGVCHGFTIKWLGARLLQQNRQFIDRMTRLLDDETVLEKIAEFKEKIKKSTPSDTELTSELQFWVELLGTDTLGFLDSLMLFHKPKKFAQIFNNAHLSQNDYQRISLLADSDDLRARGGLARLHSQTGIYTAEDLIKHLSDLEKTMGDMGDDAPKTFGLMFSGHVPIDDHNSGFHSIGAIYDTEHKKWVFMDINQWPPSVAVNPEEQVVMLQESIFTAFNFYAPNTPHVSINTEVIVLGEDVAQRPHLKKAFHKNHWTSEHLAQHHDLTSFVAVAAMHDDDDCIMAAHQAGFDLNAPLSTLSTGNTPLILACNNRSRKAIKALHQCGVDFNQSNRTGKRPAVEAAGKFSPKMLKQLVQYGADLNRVGQETFSPLAAVIYFRNAAVIPVFKACHIDLNSPDKHGNTPLHLAITEDYPSGVTALLTAGAEINVRNMYGKTPLYNAINCRNSACFNTLLEAHANVTLADNTGNTPLHEACRLGKTEMVAQLLAHNAHINHKNKHGETALSIAVRNNDVATSLLLIQQGADLELQNNDGDTPLLTAIRTNKDIAIIHALIKARANVNHCNQEGFTALHELLMYTNVNAQQLVRTLLENGANVNQCTKDGEHPVCIAISWCCSEEVLLALLKADVDLLTPTSSGKVPLIEAVQYSNANIRKHLLNYQCAKYGTLFMNGLAKTPTTLLTSILAITGLAHLWRPKEPQPTLHPGGFFNTQASAQKPEVQTKPQYRAKKR